jgi:hypothetical protein
MRYSFFSLSAIGLVLLGTSSLHGELTEAEQLYQRLRKTRAHKMELYAKRWLSLIELQDWTDATGKYRVKAKYLSHDENLESVTLRAVKGKGKDRVEREITVPVAKLSPQAQSRVQRIARFQPKLLKELEAAEQAAIEKEDSDEFRPGLNPEFREEGRPDPPPVPGRRPSDRGNPAARPPAARVPPRPGQPTEGPREPGVVQGVENPYGGTQWIGRDQLVTDSRFRNNQPPEFNTPGGPGQRTGQPPPPGEPNLVDGSPWRTSYPELLRRIKVLEGDGQSPRIDLTELGLFGQQIERNWTLMQSLANQDVGTMLARSSEVLPEGVVGEVIWEAFLVEPPKYPGSVVSLDLPSPPEPVQFQFFADDKLETGNWKQFKPGDRVRFIARLGPMATKPTINFHIRLPDQVQTMPPGPPGAPRQQQPQLPPRPGLNIAPPPGPGTEPALPQAAPGATTQNPKKTQNKLAPPRQQPAESGRVTE